MKNALIIIFLISFSINAIYPQFFKQGVECAQCEDIEEGESEEGKEDNQGKEEIIFNVENFSNPTLSAGVLQSESFEMHLVVPDFYLRVITPPPDRI